MTLRIFATYTYAAFVINSDGANKKRTALSAGLWTEEEERVADMRYAKFMAYQEKLK